MRPKVKWGRRGFGCDGAEEFGYSTLQKFVSHIPGLELVTENENVKRLRKKEAEGKKTVVEQLKKTSYSRKRKLGR